MEVVVVVVLGHVVAEESLRTPPQLRVLYGQQRKPRMVMKALMDKSVR